jgi:hypothetical protein
VAFCGCLRGVACAADYQADQLIKAGPVEIGEDCAG